VGDEFLYNTNAGGASTTKSAFVDPMKSGAAVVEESDQRRGDGGYGEVALVTGTAHVDVTLKGEDKTLHSRYLHLEDGQDWKLVARQATYLPEKK